MTRTHIWICTTTLARQGLSSRVTVAAIGPSLVSRNREARLDPLVSGPSLGYASRPEGLHPETRRDVNPIATIGRTSGRTMKTLHVLSAALALVLTIASPAL